MGKKIDVFVLSVSAAFALYLYFCHAIGNHTIALLLAGCVFLLFAKLLKKLSAHICESPWMQKRRFRKQAGSVFMRFACMEAEEARKQLAGLLKSCYNCDAPLELIQSPPTSNLSQDSVFELWKKHRGEEQLVICTCCAADNACHSLCANLTQPKIALLDAGVLTRLLAEYPHYRPSDNDDVRRKNRRIRRLGALLIQRKNAPRCLLFSFVLLMMYLLGGKVSNLIGAMALLFLALIALKRPPRPAKLF